MLATARRAARTPRTLAAVAALAVTMALMPLAGAALAQPADACPADAPDAPFTDRQSISTAHRDNVDCAAFNDIVVGFADNTYRPRLQVRRDQMASFIARTLVAAGVALPAPDPVPFTDVPPSNPHADNIQRLKAAGIIEGAPSGLGPTEYGPALRTRRDQMASFLIRAAEFAQDAEFASTIQRFDDVPPGNTHFANVNAAAELGLARGVSPTLFAPSQATLRDQMASFVVRLLRFLLGEADGPVLDLAIAQTACVVGDELTATATLSVEGDVVQGEAIGFATSGAATTPETATVTTDAAGEADFTFTVEEAGTVTVTANFAADNQSASATAQLACEAATAGVVVAFDTTADTYTYVPDAGDTTATVDYDPAADTFSVDGASATAAAFEANLTVGDRITVSGEGVLHHALVNVDPPDEGVVGNINTSLAGGFPQTYAVIEPVTGTQLSGFISYATTCDLYQVGGAPATVELFQTSLSEGDVLERSVAAGLETCALTNRTVSGTVADAATDPHQLLPAATFRINNLGDSFDDAATRTGTLTTDDAHFLVDPGYTQTFTVDGVAATRLEFVVALSHGDQASYARAAGAETFTLVNAAPTTLSGLATEAFAPGLVADGGTFSLLPADAPTRQTVSYTATATYVVDGLMSTEAEFEVAYTAGDAVSYTPADAPTGTQQTVSLTNQELTGIPRDINTDADTYDVGNAAGGAIYTGLGYTAAVFGGTDRYFVDGTEVAIGPFETALTACGAATGNPCSIRVVGTPLATEHRLTTS